MSVIIDEQGKAARWRVRKQGLDQDRTEEYRT